MTVRGFCWEMNPKTTRSLGFGYYTILYTTILLYHYTTILLYYCTRVEWGMECAILGQAEEQ